MNKKIYYVLTALVMLLVAVSWPAAAVFNYLSVTGVFFSGNTAQSNPAINLIDDDASTYWRLQPGATQGWVELKLEAPALIQGLKIAGALPSGAELTVEYRREQQWLPFSAATFTDLPENELIDLSYDRAVTDRLRLRLQGADLSAARLSEVKALGVAAQTVYHRIAPRRVTGSSNTAGVTKAEFLTDNNTYTCWMTRPGIDLSCRSLYEKLETFLGNTEYLKNIFNWNHFEKRGEVVFNLGNSYALNNINIFFTGNTSGDLTVETEENGVWRKIGFIAERREPGWYRVDFSEKKVISSNIRIVMANNGLAAVGGLAEVEFWGYGDYQGNQVRLIGPQEQEGLAAAINREFQLTKAEAGVGGKYRLEVAVATAAATDEPLPLIINGREYQADKITRLRGQNLYRLPLTAATVWDENNFLRIPAGTGTLTGAKIVLETDGRQTYGGGPLNDGLLLTAATNVDEKIIKLGQKTLVEAVILYGAEEFPVTVYYRNKNDWSILSPTEIAAGNVFFKTNILTDALKIVNPSLGYFSEIEIMGGAVTDHAPVIQLFQPEDGATLDVTELNDQELIGFIDNSKAKVRVNGQNVFQVGHYFGVNLVQLGINSFGEIPVDIMATDPEGRVSRQKISISVGTLPLIAIDRLGVIEYTDKETFTVSGIIRQMFCAVKVNGKVVSSTRGNFAATVSLAEGLNLIKIESVLKTGGQSFTQTVYKKVVRYSQAIRLTVAAPLDGEETNAAAVVVSGQIYGAGALQVTVNGKRAWVVGNSFSLGGIKLAEGQNVLTVTGWDARGATQETMVKVYRDLTAPVINVTSPPNGAFLNTASLTVTGTVAERSLGYLTVNGQVAEVADGVFTARLSLAEQWNVITLQARDTAGNVATATLRVMVDTQPPLAFTVTADPSGWTNNTRPTVSFSATDEGSGIDCYLLSVDGGVSEKAASPYQLPALADGEHTVSVKAVDKAGNYTLSSVRLYIDTVPPSTPAKFTVIPGINRVELNWEDPRGEISGYRIRRSPGFAGGELLELNRANPDGIINNYMDGTARDGQTYSYAIQARDRAGNYGEFTADVTVTAGEVTTTVGPDETTVEFDDWQLSISEGALEEELQLAVKAVQEKLPENKYAVKTGESYSFELLKEDKTECDTEFKEPVTLKVSYASLAIPSGYDYGDLGIYWFNREGGYWEKLDYVRNDIENKTLSVCLRHFSDYQVMVSNYVSPSLDSYYDLGIAPFLSYYRDNVETVSTTGGSLNISATDLKLPGRDGMNLNIKRIYDSSAVYQERMIEANSKIDAEVYHKTPVDTFGAGWALNIPWIEETDKGKFVRLPEGQTIKIELKDDRFEYHKGIHFILAGYKKLTLADGTVFEFDDSGRAVKQIDPSGLSVNTIVYEYRDRELTKITDSIGREINFTYITVGGKRVIHEIQTGTRAVRYEYNDTGLLTEVFDPLDRKTAYAYEAKALESGYSYSGSDKIVKFTVDLLNKVTYPTGESSVYSYEYRDQGKKEGGIRHAGTKILAQKRTVAGKETTYSYTMNAVSGSLSGGGSYTPANTYIASCQKTEGERVEVETCRQLEGSFNLVDLPDDSSYFQGTLVVARQTLIDSGTKEYEKVDYLYDLAVRAISNEQHYRGGGLAYEVIVLYDNWGNITYWKDSSRNLEEWRTYQAHDRIKNLVRSKRQKNSDACNGTESETTTTYEYNEALGKAEKITVNGGAEPLETGYAYDAATGNLLTITAPNGRLTEIAYDKAKSAFPVKEIIRAVKDADNQAADIVTEYGYNPETGLKEWEKDGRGFVTHYEYDLLNRVIKAVLPDDDDDPTNNPYREYLFDDSANLCDFYNEKRQRARFVFDGLGRLTQIIKYTDQGKYPAEVKTTYAYDNQGRIIAVTDPRGATGADPEAYTTRYQYDALDRVVKVTFPDGNYAALAYDDLTNTVTITDENGAKVAERSDWANRLVEAKQYCGYEGTEEIYSWQFYYDSRDNRIRQVDPLGNQVDRRFDPLGRLVETDLPRALLIKTGAEKVADYRPVLTNGYDKMGNKIWEIGPNGNSSDAPEKYKIEYEYDLLGRVIKLTTKATDPINQTVTVSITRTYYDAAGNKVKVIDPNGGEWSYTYSARGDLLTETDPRGETIRYRYDALGNKIAVTDPRGDGVDNQFTT